MSEALHVLVASSDSRFRRLAGAALTRAGHEVHTVTPRLWRVERLIELHRPEVLVIDMRQPLPPAEIAAVMRTAGAQFDSPFPIVYAYPCPFRGHRVAHLVVDTHRRSAHDVARHVGPRTRAPP